MQTLLEAANHIAQEIERTRLHLTNLEQALEGLKPLITVDAGTTISTFALSSQVQPIEDLSIVNAEVTAKKKTTNKSTVKPKGDKSKADQPTAKTPKEAKAKPVVAAPVAEVVKLPATGADLWLKCLGRKKATVAQIADAALKKLKLDDSARAVITSRAKAWTYMAAKKGDLIEVGMRDGSKLYQLTPVKDEKTTQSDQTTQSATVAEAAPVTVGGSAK